jgi:hypothetical protein
MKYAIKAVGDWEIDILAIPFGGPDDRDADGEYFSSKTNVHLDKFPTPPLVYYHGSKAPGQPSVRPEYIGRTLSHRIDESGVWVRGVLDKASELAGKVWAAVQAGTAYASSGSVAHLVRKTADAMILEWPLAEISVFDTEDGKQPANKRAVALPAMKAVYEAAGLSMPLDIEPEPEADDTGSTIEVEQKSGAVQTVEDNDDETMENSIMEPKDVQQIVADALKADREAAAAEAASAAERQAEIDKAVKAERERIEAELADKETKDAEGRRLRGGDTEGAPYVAKFANTWKYDNIDNGDLALMHSVLDSAHRSGRSKYGASEDSAKALAVRLAENTDPEYTESRQAMKAANMPMKSNELNQSTLANYGDEWIGVTYSSQMWERIRQDTPVVGRIPTIEVPQGSESVVIPLESTPPTFYKVAQASAQAANPGAITRTVTTSKMGTDNVTLPVAKMGAATYFTGELEEDSIIPWIAELRRSIEQEGAEVLEHVVIDGDTDTSATTNINDIGGTPAGSEAFLLFNGFRKSCLVTTTANSRDGGTLAIEDYLETLKLMGLGGKNALPRDRSMVAFIQDLYTGWKALELAQVKTQDVYSNPTIENGQLTSIWGRDVITTANMHRANQDATYGLKANSAGKLDLDTAANNLYGAILAVRFDQWRLGYKRRMTIETTRVPSADSTEIVALMRVGLIQRDTEASAISYNLTV